MNLNFGGVVGALSGMFILIGSSLTSSPSAQKPEPLLNLIAMVIGGCIGNFLWTTIRGDRAEIAKSKDFDCPTCGTVLEGRPGTCPSCKCDIKDKISQITKNYSDVSGGCNWAAVVAMISVLIMPWCVFLAVPVSILSSALAIFLSQKAINLMQLYDAGNENRSSLRSARKFGVYSLGFEGFLCTLGLLHYLFP